MEGNNILEEYGERLRSLQALCAKAEHDKIVSQTNLDNLRKQREKLVRECEAFIGAPFEQAAQMLEEKKATLDALMAELDQVDLSQGATQETADRLQAVADKYGITTGGEADGGPED